MKLQKFDYQIKDNKKNKSFIAVGLFLVALVVGVVLYKSFAAYKVTESYNIIKGTVGEFSYEPLKITYNLVGEDGGVMSSSEIPSSEDYEFDAESSTCVNGSTITYNADTNTFVIGDGSDTLEEECNIYFNFIPLSLRTLYALGYTLDDVNEGVPYGPDGTNVSGFYAAPDNYGTSYYFYGATEYPPLIEFGSSYGLLVRINGDGSVRVMIEYSERYWFNKNVDDNTYLGFMYGEVGADNILNTHSNKTNSYVKNYFIENYYYDYLESESGFLGDAYFCNDRSLYKEEYGEKEPNDTALGTGKNTTYYGSYYRLRNNTPSLMCDKNDAFTVEESKFGNGNNKVYVGMLSIDEIYMTAIDTWESDDIATISPSRFENNTAYHYVSFMNSIMEYKVNEYSAMFPVVNLRYGLTYEGDPSWFIASE